MNERNITWSDTSGITAKEDISPVVEVKERYKSIRADIALKTNKDRRVMKELLAKYGNRERQRTIQFVHRVSKAIVEHAKHDHLKIKMEKLTGIRKLYRRGNGQSASYRGRMNTWIFGEFKRQVEYKAHWEGIPVTFVNPKGTSRIYLCGTRVKDMGDRRLKCPVCGKIWDRDELASKNVMAAPSVRAARPSRRSDDEGTRRRL